LSANQLQQVQTANGISPAMLLREMLTGYWTSQSIYAIAKLGVADLLRSGPQSSEQLAGSLLVNKSALYRMMHTLSSYGLFAEDDKHNFALTPLGSLLQTDVPGSMRAMAVWNGELSYRAWGAVLHSLETGQPALRHALGMKLFEYLSQHPESRQVFDEAMTGLALQVSQAVVTAYDFSGVKRVVDVGGGQGTLAATILLAHDDMKAIVFDLPDAVESARKQIKLMGLESRCEIVGGDFFEHIPPGGDCYLMASVIHDWDDEHSLRILKQCRRAMDQGARLLLVDCVITDSAEPQFAKLLDLQMLVVTGGLERTEARFRELLAAAQFRVTKIIRTAVPESIVEAVAI
jgi:precorrin-6B methylase 2